MYPMLKKLGKQYTPKRIRTWKKHYGNAAAAASATISGQTASSSSTGAQPMTDMPSVPADIQEMERKVGPFIRSKGNPQERVLYAMLRDEGHDYTRRQVRLWKRHYCTAVLLTIWLWIGYLKAVRQVLSSGRFHQIFGHRPPLHPPQRGPPCAAIFHESSAPQTNFKAISQCPYCEISPQTENSQTAFMYQVNIMDVRALL